MPLPQVSTQGLGAWGVVVNLVLWVLSLFVFYLIIRQAVYRGVQQALYEAGLRKTPWPPSRPDDVDDDEGEAESDSPESKPGVLGL